MLFHIMFWLLNNLLETRIKTLETTQMSAHVRENYPVVGRAGSACNSRDAQDILARTSPSENF